MEIHNTRSSEQWRIISSLVGFQDKIILDLGCGKGDILTFAAEAGAYSAGVDNDRSNIDYIKSTYPEIEAIYEDIDRLLAWPQSDIVICFSVLPYLPRPEHTLQWINIHSEVSLIECQYAGDGPGFDFLKTNDDMEKWLLSAGQFSEVKAIGYTLVEGRDKRRYIWMCE